MTLNLNDGFSPAMYDAVTKRLRQEYKGIFPASQFPTFIDNHLSLAGAEHFINRIKLDGDFESVGDFGCGYGSFSLLAAMNGYDVTGIDLAEFEIDIAKQRHDIIRQQGLLKRACKFYRGSIFKTDIATESLDVVTLWNVLEHVSDPKGCLIEAKRVLRPGGRIYIVCPNYLALRYEAHYQVPWFPLMPRWLASQYLIAIGKDPSFFEKHIHYTTPSQIRKLINNIGLAEFSYRESAWTPAWAASKLPFLKLLPSPALNGLVSLARFTLSANPIRHTIEISCRKAV
jgi:2-polyprenyl-3-methyl-5-hydroxy-6-metoxy-1,4-benzoquinol methylase